MEEDIGLSGGGRFDPQRVKRSSEWVSEYTNDVDNTHSYSPQSAGKEIRKNFKTN